MEGVGLGFRFLEEVGRVLLFWWGVVGLNVFSVCAVWVIVEIAVVYMLAFVVLGGVRSFLGFIYLFRGF